MQEPIDMKIMRLLSAIAMLALGGDCLATTGTACPNIGYFASIAALIADYPPASAPVCTQAATGDFGPLWNNGTSWIAFNASAWNPSSVPAPAGAVGYTQQTFSSSAWNSGNSTTAPAGNWYSYNIFGATMPAGGIVQNANGSLTLTGIGNQLTGIDTIAYNNSYSPIPFKGIAFGGGAYFQCSYSFSGTPSGNNNVAFLIGDVEEATGYVSQTSGHQWLEYDVGEWNANSFTSHGFSMWNWYKLGGGNVNVEPPSVVASSPITGISPNAHQGVVEGLLWVPATATTQGYVIQYENGAVVGQQGTNAQGISANYSWNQYNASCLGTGAGGTLPPNFTTSGACPLSALSVTDVRHMHMIMLSSYATTPALVTNCQVWQASTVGNIVH
jgi:hypothetical protein